MRCTVIMQIAKKIFRARLLSGPGLADLVGWVEGRWLAETEDGGEKIEVTGVKEGIAPGALVEVIATRRGVEFVSLCEVLAPTWQQRASQLFAQQEAMQPLFDLLYQEAQKEGRAEEVLHFCQKQLGLIPLGDERLAALLEAVAQAKPLRMAGGGDLLARALLEPGSHQRARIVAAQGLLWAPPKKHFAELFAATLQLAEELGEDRRRLKVYPTLLLLAQPEHTDQLCTLFRTVPRDVLWALAEGVEERYHSEAGPLPLPTQEQLVDVLAPRFWQERQTSPGREARPSVLSALVRAVGLLATENNLDEVAKMLAVAYLNPRELERGTVPRTVFLLAERLEERGLLAVKRAFKDEELALCRLWYLSGRMKI
jgi:hypothetical protein